LARTPLDVYKGIASVETPSDVSKKMMLVANRFSDLSFAGQGMPLHLSRLMSLVTRLVAYLESSSAARASHLTCAVDVLDHFMSTSRWWMMSREDPGFIIRPPSRDPRQLIKSLSSVSLSGGTLSRISGAAEKLESFLREHNVGSADSRASLRDSLTSTWALLSAVSCKGQGRTSTSESDFEVAYDVTRIMLFYTPLEDFHALGGIRLIARSPLLPKLASVTLSPGFERQLESSLAARLESSYVPSVRGRSAVAVRNVLTNSLRVLVQIQAASDGLERIEESDYADIVARSLNRLQVVGIPPTLFQNEDTVLRLLSRLPRNSRTLGRLDLIMQRLKNLVADAQKRDFLLHYARLVPRLISLVLLLSSATSNTDGQLKDIDLKRGLNLTAPLLVH